MSDLKEMLQTEYERMHRIREAAELQLLNSSDVKGKLRISVRENQVMYYHRLHQGESNGIYFPKKKREFAQKLAQKTLKRLPRWIRFLFLLDIRTNVCYNEYMKIPL